MSTLPDLPEWQRPVTFYGKPLTFNPRNHRYYWDGSPVPSVTTIINRLGKGDALIQWAANCAVDHIRDNIGADMRVPLPMLFEQARKAHTAKKDAAADIGTRVHEYAKLALQGKSPPEPDAALDGPAYRAIEAFWQWVEQHKIEPLAVERRVMSKEHLYAGTTDFYGRINGLLAVLDFKTGKGVYDEAWWQTSAYSMALLEEAGLWIDGKAGATGSSFWPVRWVVHLNKETGECSAHCRDSIEDHQADMSVWLSLLALDKSIRAARKHPQPKRAA